MLASFNLNPLATDQTNCNILRTHLEDSVVPQKLNIETKPALVKI